VPVTDEGLAFPSRVESAAEVPTDNAKEEGASETMVDDAERTPTEEPDDSHTSTIAAVSEVETPSTSHPPSEADSTHPTTPSSTMPPPQARPAGASHTRNATKPVVPLIPIRPAKAPSAASTTQKSAVLEKEDAKKPQEPTETAIETDTAEDTPKSSPPSKAVPPKSWAALFTPKAPAAGVVNSATPDGVETRNGVTAPLSNSLADVLASFSVDSEKKISFLEPRGLVNYGNVCYMNSVGCPLMSQ
jgi:ubiquitin carboxyl-terminal hydrolase 10